MIVIGESEQQAVMKTGKLYKRPGTSLLQDILELLLKIVFMALVVVVLFTFVFGAFRSAEPSMLPSIKDGDLVMYYRIDKQYAAQDAIVYSYKGQTMIGRVVAIAGDKVDITDDGNLKVNGSVQQEQGIYFKTNRFTEGVDFPITVGQGQVFVLGDNREHATDSRIFGCVNINDTKGKVIGILRRRNL